MTEICNSPYWNRIVESREHDKTRLSYWFPKLEAANLPVPYTLRTRATLEEIENLFDVQMGAKPDPAVLCMVDRIAMMAQKMQFERDKAGQPFFLRTDYTSGKHNWKNTCYVSDATHDTILKHMLNILEYSVCNYLPIDTWVIREMLPVSHYGIFRAYGNMPLAREYRFFVNDNNIERWHPYWPDDAWVRGAVKWTTDYPWEGNGYLIKRNLAHLDHNEAKDVFALARDAGAVLGGKFSVDIMATDRGWYIIDCAESEKSDHDPDCQKNKN